MIESLSDGVGKSAAATIKEIAKECGYSVPTVSQILNQDKAHLFRGSTRDKVMAAARKVGYRRNSSARAMRTGRFDAIAILSSPERRKGRIEAELLEGLEGAVLAKDLHLLLGELPEEKLTDEGELPKVLREWMADGLLINYHAEVPSLLRKIIVDHRIPSIWINVKHDSDCIHPNDFEAGRTATRFLFEKGGAEIVYADFMTVGTGHYSAVDRYEGYAQVMRKADREPARMSEAGRGDYSPAERVALAKSYLSSGNRPAGVLAYNRQNAIPVLMAALSLGLKVPEDLRIVTFDDHSLAAESLPFDTMLIPSYQIGKEAVELLLQKIKEPDKLVPGRAVSLTMATLD